MCLLSLREQCRVSERNRLDNCATWRPGRVKNSNKTWQMQLPHRCTGHLEDSSWLCSPAISRRQFRCGPKTNLFHHHHHHRVARPWQDIAISMSLRHLERSCARFQAELIPRLCCWRSSSIVRSQVRLGRPGGRCQSTGSQLMAACRAREWSWDGPARAMWPNRRSRLVVIRWVAGGWQVLRLTSSFVTCAVYGKQAYNLWESWFKRVSNWTVFIPRLLGIPVRSGLLGSTCSCYQWSRQLTFQPQTKDISVDCWNMPGSELHEKNKVKRKSHLLDL